MTSVPAFVARFLRAEKFLATVEDRRDRFEGYQDLLWSLELLLRDILSDAAGSVDIEGRTLSRLVQAVRDVAGLPKPLLNGLGEVVNHRNIYVHGMKSDELDGSTYLDDLECVKLVALWYLRDFQKGPRLSSAEASRLLAGGWATGNASPTKVQVFISYARENETQARDLHKRLKDRGHRPWMDKYELLPGQEYEFEIRRAVERADCFIALMSRSSVTKKGFVQKEIRFALEVLGEIPQGRIYFVPVRLEECEVPDSIRQLQWIDLQAGDAYAKLWRALETPVS